MIHENQPLPASSEETTPAPERPLDDEMSDAEMIADLRADREVLVAENAKLTNQLLAALRASGPETPTTPRLAPILDPSECHHTTVTLTDAGDWLCSYCDQLFAPIEDESGAASRTGESD